MLKHLTARVKAARARLSHFVGAEAIAQRRVDHYQRNYRRFGQGTPEKGRAGRKLRAWRIRLFRVQHLKADWRGIVRRRVRQKQAWLKAHPPLSADGFATFDGLPVAPWMVGEARGPDGRVVNWLQLSRDKGWSGVVVSGVRTAAHSVQLCEAMCGAPSCPGRCAGATSNHNCTPGCPAGSGAVDVTDYYRFKAIQAEIGSPLRNDLPADPVHFSSSGH